jgi:hypothetical protein
MKIRAVVFWLGPSDCSWLTAELWVLRHVFILLPAMFVLLNTEMLPRVLCFAKYRNAATRPLFC